jgi:hypothetical protein
MRRTAEMKKLRMVITVSGEARRRLHFSKIGATPQQKAVSKASMYGFTGFLLYLQCGSCRRPSPSVLGELTPHLMGKASIGGEFLLRADRD